MKSKIIGVRVSEELHTAVNNLAKEEKRNVSELTEFLFNSYLQFKNYQRPDLILQSASPLAK